MNSADHNRTGSRRVGAKCEHQGKGWGVEPAVGEAASVSVADQTQLGLAVADLSWTGV
jgi:hypothetical protein